MKALSSQAISRFEFLVVLFAFLTLTVSLSDVIDSETSNSRQRAESNIGGTTVNETTKVNERDRVTLRLYLFANAECEANLYENLAGQSSTVCRVQGNVMF